MPAPSSTASFTSSSLRSNTVLFTLSIAARIDSGSGTPAFSIAPMIRQKRSTAA